MVGISRMSVQEGGGDLDFSLPTREAYMQLSESGSRAIAYDTNQMIKDFRQVVSKYRVQFDADFNNYISKNNVMRKIKKSLTVGKNDDATRSQEIAISASDFEQNKKATRQFLQTMDLGHSLLLQMRETLTGQKISTKFTLEYNGKLYQIDEDDVPPEALRLVPSTFGGGTVSNPFSLAYELDIEVLKCKGLLEQEDSKLELIPLNLSDNIMALKPSYLAWKSTQTHRQYPNIYFDSKDAEIFELLQQEVENGQSDGIIALDRYIDLRASMGGGGGYATPFYKMGDIGLKQIKFFKFKNRAKVATVNFARFSLLRDRFQQLESILNKDSTYDIVLGLKDFFTEKEKNITPEVSKILNEEAIAEILKWIT